MAFVTYTQHNTLRGMEDFADVDAALARAEELLASGRIAHVCVEAENAGTLVCLFDKQVA